MSLSVDLPRAAASAQMPSQSSRDLEAAAEALAGELERVGLVGGCSGEGRADCEADTHHRAGLALDHLHVFVELDIEALLEGEVEVLALDHAQRCAVESRGGVEDGLRRGAGAGGAEHREVGELAERRRRR